MVFENLRGIAPSTGKYSPAARNVKFCQRESLGRVEIKERCLRIKMNSGEKPDRLPVSVINKVMPGKCQEF